MSRDAYLAIDFGTTQTTAAAWVEGGRPDLVRLDGRVAPMPSAVFHDGGQLLVGSPALRALRGDPLRGERTPKRKLRQYSDYLYLGELQLTVLEVVGRVLEHVHTQAVEAMGQEPTRVCLTCPVTWTGSRAKVLRTAATIGISCPIEIISEAEGAARHLGRDLRVGESCLVYDLGAGTCDIAIMEMTSDGLESRGDEEREIGGETFDERLLRFVLSSLDTESPDAARRLEAVLDDPHTIDGADEEALQWHRCAAVLGDNIRSAKVRLSSRNEAALVVPDPVGCELSLSRADLEQLIAEDLEETVEAAAACVQESPVTPDVVYLAGAASATPAVRRTLAQRMGMQPTSGVYPKSATVLGALRKAAAPMIERQAAARAEAETLKRKEEAQAADERARVTDEARTKIRSSPLGKPRSRAVLADSLRDGETCLALSRCAPPESILRNGLILATEQRILWTRETRTGSPAVHALAWDQISDITRRHRGDFTLWVASGGQRLFASVDATAIVTISARLET